MNAIHHELKRPFPLNRIHWRTGSTNARRLGVKPHEATEGSALAYIDARDVIDRLDTVLGAENWQARYPLSESGLLICDVGIRATTLGVPVRPDALGSEWIWKANGAGDTQVEAEKGKASDAFKRAAVLWGVGRYLYSLPFAWVKLSKGKIIDPPTLPDWADPKYYDELMRKKQERNA